MSTSCFEPSFQGASFVEIVSLCLLSSYETDCTALSCIKMILLKAFGPTASPPMIPPQNITPHSLLNLWGQFPVVTTQTLFHLFDPLNVVQHLLMKIVIEQLVFMYSVADFIQWKPSDWSYMFCHMIQDQISYGFWYFSLPYCLKIQFLFLYQINLMTHFKTSKLQHYY